MKVVCLAIVLYFGHRERRVAEAVEPKSINLALETVLQFDGKNHAADLETISNVQKFLENIKHVISEKKRGRRHNEVIKNVKLTDFILEAAKILKTYKDRDLEEVFALLDDESRKYHYKGCKFYELLDNHHGLRKFMSKKLEEGKSAPAETLRRYLDKVIRTLKTKEFKEQDNNITSLVDSLYIDSDKHFDTVLQGLRTFKHRQRADDASTYLRQILSNGLRSVVFNYYSNLNDNARQQLKNTVYNYWNDYTTSLEKNRFKSIDINTLNRDKVIQWSQSIDKNKYQKTTRSVLGSLKEHEASNIRPEAIQNLQWNIKTSNAALQSFINKMGFGFNKTGRNRNKFRNIEKHKMGVVKNIVKSNKKVTKKDPLTLEHKIMLNSIEIKELSAKLYKSKTGADASEEEIFGIHKKVTTSKKISSKAPSENKKYTKKPANLKSSSEELINTKAESDVSQSSELNDILKKYDESNENEFKEENKSTKRLRSHEFENGELGLLIGGQKIRDIHNRAVKTTTKSQKKTTKREESSESSTLKGIKSHNKNTKKPKHHHSLRAQRRITTYAPKIQTASLRKSFTALAASISGESEGLTIESFENKNIETHSKATKTRDSSKDHDSSMEHDSRHGHDSRKAHNSKSTHDYRKDHARDSKNTHDPRKSHISQKTRGSRKNRDSRKNHDPRHAHGSSSTYNPRKTENSSKDDDLRHTHDSRKAHISRQTHDFRKNHYFRHIDDSRNTHDAEKTDDFSKDYDSRMVHVSRHTHDSRKAYDSKNSHESEKIHHSKKIHNYRKDHDSRKTHDSSIPHVPGKVHYYRKDHDSRKGHDSRKDRDSRNTHNFKKTHDSRQHPDSKRARHARKLYDVSDYYYDNENETIYYPNKSVNVVSLIQKLEKQIESVKDQMNKDKLNQTVSERTVSFKTTTLSLTKGRTTLTTITKPTEQDTTTAETSRTVGETTKIDMAEQKQNDIMSSTIPETTTMTLSSTLSEVALKSSNITTIHDIIKNQTIEEPKKGLILNQSVIDEIDRMFTDYTDVSAKMSMKNGEDKKQMNTNDLALAESNKTKLTSEKLDLNVINLQKTTAPLSTKRANNTLNETTIPENILDPLKSIEDDQIDSLDNQFGNINDIELKRKKEKDKFNGDFTNRDTSLVGESKVTKDDEFDDPFKDLSALD